MTKWKFEIQGEDDQWVEIKAMSPIPTPEPVARLVDADTGEVIEEYWTMPEGIEALAAPREP
jgi:hypothetical protein